MLNLVSGLIRLASPPWWEENLQSHVTTKTCKGVRLNKPTITKTTMLGLSLYICINQSIYLSQLGKDTIRKRFRSCLTHWCNLANWWPLRPVFVGLGSIGGFPKKPCCSCMDRYLEPLKIGMSHANRDTCQHDMNFF